MVVAIFVGRCGLCATTLFADGGRHRSRVPIGGIYNAVFIRRQQNLHRPCSDLHHAPKNKTADKIKRRIKRKVKLNGGRFALSTPYIISIGYISPLLSYIPPLILYPLSYIKIINIYNEKQEKKSRVRYKTAFGK